MADTADEDDEDIGDSWEDMADSGELERRMEERSKQQLEQEQKKIEAATIKTTVVIQEDTNRTLYKPQLRILKRPDSGNESHQTTQNKSEKPVHKTLAERQAQYAEARARILGSACDGSEDNDDSSESLDLKEALDAPRDLKPYVLQASSEEKPDNLIRQPFGPDGSLGFHKKR
ncbi:SUZ domain-containing protein 1 isoform X1 [Nematostella vectensis]|uniref:SUZ domain-containing protein 1 isoform X1 n=1 Tax=Nematostella vectensis TaxID=45351 RepID=UPI0020772A30|nr:SUZ domain-containing protein 1 isoform X1 [Nematostella vectensis]